MAASPSPRAATAPNLRLLLFGLPGSGKTSLLGALAHANASQAGILKGQIGNDQGKLDTLRKAAYSGSFPADDAEVTGYPVGFAPEDAARQPIRATLLDGNGVLAQQYLSGKRPFTPRDSALARAMLDADTVIVTVDATTVGQAEGGLSALGKFLTHLQEVRAQRVDVAGLPVYLVLTKCDALAKAGDTFSKWQQRIEEAKRKLGEKFADYLAKRTKTAAFGTIDLQVWAAAIGRPVLADRPASPEPYGVAELFRQTFASAAAFDQREHRAGRRLELVVGCLGFLVLMLGLVGSLFALSQPDTDRLDLEARVQTVLPAPDAKPETWLRGDLRGKLNQVHAIQQDPAFDKLPSKTRETVDRAADELTSYIQTREKFQAEIKQPYLAKNEGEFDQFEKAARGFTLPQAYADDWANTSLARRLSNVRGEYQAAHAALDQRVAWIRRQIDDGRKLDYQAYSDILPKLLKLDKKAREQVAKPWFDAFTEYRRQPAFNRPADEAIPDVTAMVWADLDKFDAVRNARKDWDKVRRNLDDTYDLIAKRLAE